MRQKDFIIRAGKLITVSAKYGTLIDGAIVIKEGIIKEVGDFSTIIQKYKDINVIDYSKYVVTPSLVDCHTHVLEYAPSSMHNVTNSTHLMGGISLLLSAISSGVTALGEQVCGHPDSDIGKKEYVEATKDLPIDIVCSLSFISIGLENIVHFSGATGSASITPEMLLNSEILDKLIEQSDYPGENIFINATPANLTESLVPRAGEIIYSQEELNKIVNKFHANGKKIGCHVGGEKAIDMAIGADFDIIHHGHGITKEQIKKAVGRGLSIVATPLGGTHLPPNSPKEIVDLAESGLVTAISTDGYLPPSTKAPWLKFTDNRLRGPESLMELANPAMIKLHEIGWNENDILKLITLNPAKIMCREKSYGSLEIGKDANFVVSNGIPGLEVTDPKDILQVYYKGEKVISKQ